MVISAKERKCQTNIANLEKGIVRICDGLYRYDKLLTRPWVLPISGTTRRPMPNGLYFVNVEERGNESHGVIVEKRLEKNGSITYHLFDPNGKRWANAKDGPYMLSVSSGDEVSTDISPKRGWNTDGYCGLWCIVVGIFLNYSDSAKEREQFYDYMDKNASPFIREIYSNLIEGSTYDYVSDEQVWMFMDALVDRIHNKVFSSKTKRRQSCKASK